MKPIRMFYLKSCPFCKKAMSYMDELRQRDIYINVKVEMIEESEEPDLSDEYEYYYVPAYYIDEELVHEGAATLEEVETVFRLAAG